MTDSQRYKIVRHFTNRRYTIDRHLTLEQAQAWCNDPETSSTTAVGKTAKARTRKHGAWFDSYDKD